MDPKLLEEFKRQIIALDKTNLPEDARLSAIYAWVEQKTFNEMAREHRQTGQCPYCGAEK